jgi:hypothetical protein
LQGELEQILSTGTQRLEDVIAIEKEARLKAQGQIKEDS